MQIAGTSTFVLRVGREVHPQCIAKSRFRIRARYSWNPELTAYMP
jgi:hypothetical protein